MKTWVKIILGVSVVLLVLLIAAATYVGIVILGTKDTVTLDNALLQSYNARIQYYDDSNELITKTSFAGANSITVEELPKHTVNAFVSIEDKEFYNHHGLNLKRIVKAGINNLFSGYAKEGASTITQQLIKNTHLTGEKTLKRKIQEAYLAIKLENKYDKNEIMQTYLNVIYFGNGAHGIQDAALNYFGHPASELTLAESATLAGLIKSPRTYSPVLDPEKCVMRRNTVLKSLLEDEKITREQYDTALNTPLKLSSSCGSTNNAYCKQVLDEVMHILNLSETDVSVSGYKVYTYQNPALQNELESAFKSIAPRSADGTLYVRDNSTGAVLGYVSTLTHDVPRQPGSLIKPVLCYGAAFENGVLSPASPIKDEKTNFGGYSPKNIGNKYLGWTNVRTAVASSLNVPAVKTLEYVSLAKAKEFAQKLGIRFDAEDNHLALALGAMRNGVTPLAIGDAYATFANEGKFVPYKFVKRIETASGRTLYTDSVSAQQVIGKDTAYLVTDTLSECVKSGTARRLKTLVHPVAAKTGTVGAKDGFNTDAWCISYDPKFTVCAWCGNTSGNPKLNLTSAQNGGSTGCALNKSAWESLQKHFSLNEEFTRPEEVEEVKLDALALDQEHVLKTASQLTPEMYIVKDIFSKRYIPKTVSDNFTEPQAPVIEAKKVNGKIRLTWKGQSHMDYEIYRIHKNKPVLITTVDGVTGTNTYEVDDTDNCELMLISKCNTVKGEVKSKPSNTVKIYKENTKTETENLAKKLGNVWFK